MRRPAWGAARIATGLVAITLALAASPAAFAHRDDYLNETFVFETLKAREFEPEITAGSGHTDEDGRFGAAALSFEYGITDHWMVDAFAGWIDRDEGDARFDRFRAETRRRFGEEGDRFVDLAASFEAEFERGGPSAEGGRRGEDEPDAWTGTARLVLSRDLGSDWNVTCNLDAGREFRAGAPDRWAPGYALAVRYPRDSFARYGAEFRQDLGHDRRTLLIPQVWFALPHEATFKLGAGFQPTHAGSDWFLRTVFEIEF